MTHTMEMLGKTKVGVKDEKVVEVGEPKIKCCPLFDKVRGIKEVTSKAAACNMEFRIEQHGMFSSRRKLDMGIFVGFGASESTMIGMEKGIIDGAVTVCDGAGTVITSNPGLIQGMGGYISGLAETEPIPEVIEGPHFKSAELNRVYFRESISGTNRLQIGHTALQTTGQLGP